MQLSCSANLNVNPQDAAEPLLSEQYFKSLAAQAMYEGCFFPSAGTVQRADVLGKIVVKAHLSDMPELTLMLGGDLHEPFNMVVQDATFHQ